MENKALLRLLVILLALSYVVIVAAVPATRSLVTDNKVDPSVQHPQAKEALKDSKNSEEVLVGMEEGGAEDAADYQGPRANPAHQPKSPGKPRA